MNDRADRQHGSKAPDAGPPAERPPRSVFTAAAALLAWLVVPWSLLLGETAHGDLVLTVCIVFSVVAFGVGAISVTLALRSRRARGRSGAAKRLATWTGTLPMRAAAVQILLIPGCLALGFTALALIDVAVRG